MVDVADLRRGLLSVVRERGGAKAESVAEALLAVPRHVFVPDVSVDEAYRDEAIVTERDAQGVPMSSSSQPTIMALMVLRGFTWVGACRGGLHPVLDLYVSGCLGHEAVRWAGCSLQRVCGGCLASVMRRSSRRSCSTPTGRWWPG